MKKIKMLVNSIANGSIGTQIVAGVVAVGVLGGAAFGGYKVYNRIQWQKQVQASIEKKKEDVLTGIEILEENLAKLPEDEDTTNLKSGLEELKAMDLETQYDEAYEKFCSLDEELSMVVKKYQDEMNNLSEELGKLDTNLFNEEELNAFKDSCKEYSEIVANNGYTEYKAKYEEVKNKYNELLAQAQAREEASKETVLENEQVASNGSSTGSTSSSSSSSSSTSSSSTNSAPATGGSNNWLEGSAPSGSSNSSSSNSGSSNSSSSNSGNSSNSGSSNSGSTSSTPSIPSGWKSDIASQIISKVSNINTNVIDTTSENCTMSVDLYNYYYGICQNLTNGSISTSTAISQFKAKTFDFLGMGQQGYISGNIGKLNVTGCDVNSIYNAIANQIGFSGRPSFAYCTVYYDSSSNTSTVTYVRIYADFID